MEIGLNLGNRGPHATPAALIEFALTADRLGFSALGVGDHIVLVRQQTAHYPYATSGEIDFDAWTPWHDTLGMVGFLAAKTERIRLGPSVLIVPYRNPLATAKHLATVDALCGGRLFLGVGTGWWREEFEALGIGEQFAERGPRTDEYLRIFKNLWTEEAPAFQGRFFQYENLIAAPKPAQPGGLPIWVGGNTRRALRRVADHGDVWHPYVQTPPAALDPAELGQYRDLLAGLYEERGRDPASIRIVAKSDLRFTETRDRLLSGNTEQLIEDLQAYEAAGIAEFLFNAPGASPAERLENLHRVAEEIMPHVA